MSRISYWYSGLSRRAKTAMTVGGVVLAALVAGAILYMALTPDKVEVRYGTIVWDPIDGHVWEDNTETIWVDASEAADYKVERIEKLSPEHEELRAQQEAALAEEQRLRDESSGYQPLEVGMPASTIEDLNALQRDMETMSQDVISGLEMANEIGQTRSTLQAHYDQVAAYEVIPEIDQYKQEYLSAISKFIQACDLVLQGIETADQSYITQAQVLYNEGTAIIQNLGAKIQDILPAQ